MKEENVGYICGRHYTTYVEEAKQLRREEKNTELEELLWKLVYATEAEDDQDKFGVAPWYYEELAKLFRKQKRYDAEVGILERFAKRRHAPGVTPPLLLKRLERAKELLRISNVTKLELY